MPDEPDSESGSQYIAAVRAVPAAIRAQDAAVRRGMRHARTGRATAGQIRVKLVCSCGRVLDHVWTVEGGGYQSRGGPAAYDELAGLQRPGANLAERLLGAAGDRVRYSCRCGRVHPLRRDRLTPAVQRAAAGSRRVLVPYDLDR